MTDRVQTLFFFRPEKESPLARFAAAGTDGERLAAFSDLVSFGISSGFSGDLWRAYLTYFLVTHENPYTLAAERAARVPQPLSDLASWDLSVFFDLFRLDLSAVLPLEEKTLAAARRFEKTDRLHPFEDRVLKCLADLSEALSAAPDAEAFRGVLEEYYRCYGVGDLALYHSFRLDEAGALSPIRQPKRAALEDLVGYETQKKLLLENTRAFLQCRRANNCLLYGDAGTGKSTSVRAIVNRFYPEGLRMIEVYKHEIRLLPALLARLADRNLRFIVFMDDLSFEEFEIEYKYLKAVIEGGLSDKPENVLVYATSNRRHLLRESVGDNRELDDLHPGDTKEEKLSLSDRFGLTIYYGSPNKKEFENIVLELKKRHGITQFSDEEILAEASRWELRHGGLSGRTAQQFIDHLQTQD